MRKSEASPIETRKRNAVCQDQQSPAKDLPESILALWPFEHPHGRLAADVESLFHVGAERLRQLRPQSRWRSSRFAAVSASDAHQRSRKAPSSTAEDIAGPQVLESPGHSPAASQSSLKEQGREGLAAGIPPGEIADSAGSSVSPAKSNNQAEPSRRRPKEAGGFFKPRKDPSQAKSEESSGGWFGSQLPDWMPKRLPNLQPFWVILSPPGKPDKKRLMTVQDFFKYTEEEGRQFWRELDRDDDGRVSADDVKAVLRKRKLPEAYASDFIKAARGNRWWANSISWDEFKALVDEREPKMLKAFTCMEVTTAGDLEQKSIKGTLSRVGVDASDDHAKAMSKALGVEEDGVVSYGKFRNFLILLPEAKLTGIDPSAIWFEAATVVPFGPPPSERSKEQRTSKMLLTAALAGGIASCASTVALFPLDTLKTRLQSTAGATIASIAKTAPNIGVRGLYRGIIPAAMGNFVSHGVRTFSYEASFSALRAFTGGAAELQLQGLSSGIGTFLGTGIRIPCEVLKQRLQTGRHTNLLEALRAATQLEGPRGLFRGTAATLSREVPFYVLGIVFFEQLKKLAKGNSFGGQGRELAPWETIALGALAGALASVGTTPADVMKTRVMTAAADQAIDPRAIFVGIIRNEGVGALFKGALFRAAWTAPQGAMNFSGYELAKKALSQQEHTEPKELQLQPSHAA